MNNNQIEIEHKYQKLILNNRNKRDKKLFGTIGMISSILILAIATKNIELTSEIMIFAYGSTVFFILEATCSYLNTKKKIEKERIDELYKYTSFSKSNEKKYEKQIDLAQEKSRMEDIIIYPSIPNIKEKQKILLLKK